MSKTKEPATATEATAPEAPAVDQPTRQMVDYTEAEEAPEPEVKTETVELAGGLVQVNYL